jgi:hypothetical protein
MANVINIGIRPEHIESRARILRAAGHNVNNAHSISDMERHLADGAVEVLVIGHNLPGPEKRRIVECLKQSGRRCAVVEVYLFLPELMTADAHVYWDQVPEALLEAVNRAASVCIT